MQVSKSIEKQRQRWANISALMACQIGRVCSVTIKPYEMRHVVFTAAQLERFEQTSLRTGFHVFN